MSAEIQPQELSIIEKSMDVFRSGGQILLTNQERSRKAVQIGQNILQAIRENGMTPELDERAMKYLVNCSKALKEENEQRSVITQLMDEIKKMYIACENEIDAKKEGSLPNLIQKERNEYARQMAEEKKRKEEEARIAAEKAKEAIAIKSDIEVKLHAFYGAYLADKKTSVLTRFNAATLDTIESFRATLQGWNPEYPLSHLNTFTIGNYSKLHTTEEVNAFVCDIVEENYTGFRANFVAELSIHKQEVLDRIPSKIEELQEEKRKAEEAEAARQEALRLQREAEAERQRKIAQERDAAARKALELQAEQERLAEQRRIEAIEAQRKADQERAEQEKRRREEEEHRKILQEQEEARKAAELEASIKAEGEKTLVLFEQETASMTDAQAPETRTGYEIEVTHQAGYVQLFQLWFEQEGKNLPLDKIDKTSFGQIRAWAEKKAHKDGEKIESKFLIYRESYKAVNRKAKP